MEEHKNTVLNFISQNAAICAKKEEKIVGSLLFSREPAVLCFLAVDPAYRRQHIANQMLSSMFAEIATNQEITVTTWREGVPEGEAARAFYKYAGFQEGKKTWEFGSPVQEFILKR